MSTREAELCERLEGIDVASRDRISSLPNDLLIQILLLVSTRDAAATMILSKRWRFIWTLVPKLEYEDTGGECKSVWKFLDKFLELHKAPVLENLCIQLGEKCSIDVVDIGKVVANAVDRFVRKLQLEFVSLEPTSLHKSLYTCKTLVELTLLNRILVDVPSSASLPSLKILRLFYVVFKDEDSLERLISSCSVLARSTVNVGITDSAYALSMNEFYYDIDIPHIYVLCHTDDKFIRAISLVTSLLITLKDPMSVDFSGITFSRLEGLKFYALGHLWLDLLLLVLSNSPELRFLCIDDAKGFSPGDLSSSWNQPRLIPRCLSHLDSFVWKGYRGNEKEKQLMRYILANSKCLNLVRISLTSTFSHEEKEVTKKELESMSRVSTSTLLFM